LIPQRLQGFVKREVQARIKNVLAHVQVINPNVPLEKLGEPTNDENNLESIERAKPEFKALANHIARSLRFRSFLLMMKLLARLCDAQMPPSLPYKDTLFKFYLVKNFFVI
jgi:hypothetical protein